MNISFSRIGSLLLYDWALNRKKVYLLAVLVTVVYACCVGIYFMGQNVSIEFGADRAEGFSELPLIIATFIYSFFSYSMLAMVFVVTSLLHNKFTQPRSATAYFTLPASIPEKFITLMLDYLFGLLVILVLYLVCFYATMGIFAWLQPGLDWMQNAFAYLTPAGSADKILSLANTGLTVDRIGEAAGETGFLFGQEMQRLVTASIRMTVFVNLCQFFFYLVLNMCFKTHGQIKSVAIYFATGFFGTIIFSILAIRYVGVGVITTGAGAALDAATNLLVFVRYALYASPVAAVALMALLYRQIRTKQAK